jgi:hypothetical protein
MQMVDMTLVERMLAMNPTWDKIRLMQMTSCGGGFHDAIGYEDLISRDLYHSAAAIPIEDSESVRERFTGEYLDPKQRLVCGMFFQAPACERQYLSLVYVQQRLEPVGGPMEGIDDAGNRLYLIPVIP